MTTPTPAGSAHLRPGPADLDAPWVRRLARSLLDDASAADDLLQDTWLCLRDEPHRAGYLAAVVRSLAWRRRRGEGRRARRERQAARPEAVPSAARVAERAEAARRLAEAVEALEEPYRTTIVLRYYDGLSGAEIARRTGTPEGTVRARLKRGLDRLRARLDDGPRGRAGWVSGLGPLVPDARAPGVDGQVHPPGHPAAATGSLGALLAVKLGTALAFTTVVVALGWGVLWRSPVGGPGPVAPGASLEATGEEPADGELPVPSLVRDQQPARDPARALDQAISPVDEPDLLRARAVDETGAPLESSWMHMPDRPEEAATRDPDGRLVLELEPGTLERLAVRSGVRLLDVEVGAPGRTTLALRPHLPEGATTLELGEIVLTQGGTISGRVLDRNGAGVEDALVVAGQLVSFGAEHSLSASQMGPDELRAELQLYQTETWKVTDRSGPDGGFRLEGVPAGHAAVWARSDSSPWTWEPAVGVRTGEQVGGLELVVGEAPGQVVTGRVLDPLGEPMASTPVVFRKGGSWRGTLTDERGEFHFVPLDGSARDLVVRSPSPEWEDARIEAVEPGTHGLRVQLERARWSSVEVVDPAGAPVPAGRVVRLPPSGPTDRALDRAHEELDQHGHARLRRTAEAIRVRVEAPGYRDRIVGPLAPDDVPDPLVVTLEPVPALVGRVLRPDGRPAAGARVGLHLAATGDIERPHWKTQAWSGAGQPFVFASKRRPFATTLADSQGRFRLALPGIDTTSSDHIATVKTGPLASLGRDLEQQTLEGPQSWQAWYVHAALEGEATLTDGPHRFGGPDSTACDEELELRLPESGSLAGQLLLPPGCSPEGWTVWASDGLAGLASAPVSREGRFRLDHLHPGAWQMRAFEPGRTCWIGEELTARAAAPDIEVVAGETTRHELRAGPRASARLRGRLWIDGQPAGPCRVVATQTEQMQLTNHRTSLDPDGLFELWLEPGVETHLRITRATPEGTLALGERTTFVAGDNDWSLDLATAVLEAYVEPGPDDLRGKRVTYESVVGSVTIECASRGDEAGRFGPLLVPAGPGVLKGARRLFEPERILAGLELAPGEERSIDLR